MEKARARRRQQSSRACVSAGSAGETARGPWAPRCQRGSLWDALPADRVARDIAPYQKHERTEWVAAAAMGDPRGRVGRLARRCRRRGTPRAARPRRVGSCSASRGRHHRPSGDAALRRRPPPLGRALGHYAEAAALHAGLADAWAQRARAASLLYYNQPLSRPSAGRVRGEGEPSGATALLARPDRARILALPTHTPPAEG